ncbi:MAG: hypothetical protein SFX74_12035 [Fimbriimonadaceae bacterium]|nr:hypothetical protein [Fimbriimonadaceae bacterium]
MKPTAVLVPFVTMLCLLACGGSVDHSLPKLASGSPIERNLVVESRIPERPGGAATTASIVPPPGRAYPIVPGLNRLETSQAHELGMGIDALVFFAHAHPNVASRNRGHVVGSVVAPVSLGIAYFPRGGNIVENFSSTGASSRVIAIRQAPVEDQHDIVEFEVDAELTSTTDSARKVRIRGTYLVDFRQELYGLPNPR